MNELGLRQLPNTTDGSLLGNGSGKSLVLKKVLQGEEKLPQPKGAYFLCRLNEQSL